MKVTFNVVLLMATLLVGMALCGPPTPRWPSRYTVSGTFDIPYWSLSAPVDVSFDASRQAVALSWFNGLDTSIIDASAGKMYALGPQVDTMKCTVSAASDLSSVAVLPEMSDFSFIGMERVEGWLVEAWQKTVTQFGLEQKYTFYVKRDMTDMSVKPIKYVLQGTDISLGSGHPDVYEWTFDSWAPMASNGAAFDVPSECNTSTMVDVLIPTYRGNSKLRHALALMGGRPGLPVVDDADELEGAFQRHVLKHGKPVMGNEMYAQRLAAYRDNARMVAEHNERFARGEHTYDLELNHFADLTLAERVMLYSPRARLERGEPAPEVERVRAPVSGNFSWTDHGAVNKVVDQAACGSCWAFGSVAALEGAQKLKHGNLPKLSEQQIVDCAWVGSSMGCGGGFPTDAYNWLQTNGGIALEESYPYLGQNAFCFNGTRDSGVRISSFVNTSTVVETIEKLRSGPMAIAIDAAAPPGDFYFYRSGIYNNPQCRSDNNHLDHEVTLVGYAEVNGQMGALLKNSWSTHWGHAGYGLLMMENNNCGWATAARLPYVQ